MSYKPKNNKHDLYRLIPKVDILLEDKYIIEYIEKYGRNLVVDVIRQHSSNFRNFIKTCNDEDLIKQKIECFVMEVGNLLVEKTSLSVKKVINGTGTILHTNLGRAPLNQKHLDRVNSIMAGYTNLEYDLRKGKRGLRYAHIEDKIKYITGAESAIVVNNNAAAVMLVLSTLAKGKEAITSRGELVEIGGSFRVPDVMAASGTKLVDVGTTNKTHVSDYEDAITENTALFLKVHTSNYKIVGFTESVSLEDMCDLGNKYQIPVYQDLGSGVLIDLSKFGLEKEPTVQDSVRVGVDVISFSGDKLLGGPQAGIIVGKKEYLDKIKKNPVTRALRVDKFTIAMLDAVLCEYLNEESVIENVPILKNLTRKVEEVRVEAEELYTLLKDSNVLMNIEIVESTAQAGGGSMPLLEIPSYAIAIFPKNMSVSELEKSLRSLETPIIGRTSHDKFLLDLRTLNKDDFNIIAEEINQIEVVD